jgi:hypothetical protein
MSWTIKGNGTGEDLLYSQAGTPSLDLRFAATKSLNDYVSGNNLITFTRTSSGTFVGSDGVLQTAATDVPRFDHNPTTGESLGLLVEEQRTNLLLRSEEFDTASWSKAGLQAFGSGSVANAIAAPNGSVTADFLVESTSTGEHFTEQAFTAVSGTSYTFSVFIKPSANKTSVMMRYTTTVFGGVTSRIQVVFATGAVTVLSGTPTGTATPLPNGWWRISITAAATENGSPAARIQFYQNNGTSTSYTGDGTSGYYLWGAQLEEGSFPTSYIPTTGAAATRSADVASITGSAFSGWYRQDEGTMFAEGAVPVGTTGPRALASIDNGTTSERIQLYHNGTTAMASIVVDGGTTQFLPGLVGNSFPAGEYRKLAIAVKATDFAAITTPGTVGTGSSGTMPIPTQLQIGFGPARTQPNLPIKRLTYFPTRLSNEVLQRITQ